MGPGLDPATVCKAYCADLKEGAECTPEECEATCLSRTSPGAFAAPAMLALAHCVAQEPDFKGLCSATGVSGGPPLPECVKFAFGSAAVCVFEANACACKDKTACSTECGESLCAGEPASEACTACLKESCF